MENVIQQIIDIDCRARQKQFDVEEYRARAEQTVADDIRKMNDQMHKSSQEKLDALAKSQAELLEEKRLCLSENLNAQKQRLEAIYQENHLKWEQELLEKLLEK